MNVYTPKTAAHHGQVKQDFFKSTLFPFAHRMKLCSYTQAPSWETVLLSCDFIQALKKQTTHRDVLACGDSSVSCQDLGGNGRHRVGNLAEHKWPGRIRRAPGPKSGWILGLSGWQLVSFLSSLPPCWFPTPPMSGFPIWALGL